MSTARILDVGQCDPDHAGITTLVRANFDAEVDRVMFVDEALAALRRARYDLVLVNRIIWADQSDGTALIRALKADADHRDVPVMLVSNLADAQQRALAEGAAPGFGKAALNAPETIERLAEFLPPKVAAQ